MPAPSVRHRAGPGIREAWRILRLAFRARREPLPYAREVADLAVRHMLDVGVDPAGRRALDVGTGGGALPEALARAGANPTAVDLEDLRLPGIDPGTTFVHGSAARLPFRDGAFDLVCSSNVLEHVPDPWGAIDELVRVARPGGAVWLSWTNWWSPIGGHEWSPFHYLGPRLGPRVYRLLRGTQPPWNEPGLTLFQVHVGETLRGLRRLDGVEVVEVAPRYWPALRFLGRIPGIREVAMWNCVVVMRRVQSSAR